MRYIESVLFMSVIVRTRPISMGAVFSAAGSADWAHLSQASVPRRDTHNQRIVAISSEGSQTMGTLEEGPDVNTVEEAALQGHARATSLRRVPCNDATGRVLPITPEEQAQDAQAIAAFVELMFALPDDDPPGAWRKRCGTLTHSDRIGSFSRALLVMARLILLDSGPLGSDCASPAPSSPQVGRCLGWVQTIRATGAIVIIPEIAHYELRRELHRIRAVGSLRRLDYALNRGSGFRHLTLSTDAIIKAAEFWSFLRQSGIPTASPDALDADAILAGQAALAGQPGDTVTIATTNPAHLNRFPGIDAQTWDQIR